MHESRRARIFSVAVAFATVLAFCTSSLIALKEPKTALVLLPIFEFFFVAIGRLLADFIATREERRLAGSDNDVDSQILAHITYEAKLEIIQNAPVSAREAEKRQIAALDELLEALSPTGIRRGFDKRSDNGSEPKEVPRSSNQDSIPTWQLRQ